MAALIGVTESYISPLLSGRSQNISAPIANLMEEKLGYNAQWILSGEEPKYKQPSKNPNLSDVPRQVISQLENMPEREIQAVLAFIRFLNEIEKSLSDGSGN